MKTGITIGLLIGAGVFAWLLYTEPEILRIGIDHCKTKALVQGRPDQGACEAAGSAYPVGFALIMLGGLVGAGTEVLFRWFVGKNRGKA